MGRFVHLQSIQSYRYCSYWEKLIGRTLDFIGMYSVKPFYDSRQTVEISNVMYKVKNFHESHGEMNSVEDGLDPLAQLEKQQDAIFARLADLKQTLDELSTKYEAPKLSVSASVKKDSSSADKTSASSVESPLGNGIHDVVICADPEKPPLSLFILFELLKKQFKVLATSYVHSSVAHVDASLCDLIKSGSQVVRGEHQVALSVIWKKVDDGPQLMISPTKQSVISGEVNVARYVNRLLSPSFDTEDIMTATTVDEWLDTIDNQIFNGNSKQKAAALKSLNVRLKKNDWIVGSEVSLVDVVMWSSLHQSQQVAGAPEYVQKWLKACANVPFFKNALTLI